ncbi:MAG TPA: FAD-dependent monooxygenase, partial [Polyangiales bacterium]|nr:FAD-dependent monooxygenase [Polyangiales bacterium]
MTTKTHDVLICGAGPTGLTLAAELALAHVSVVLIERRATQTLPGSRAGGLHARSIELLDQRGVAGRFVSQGKLHRAFPFAQTILDLSDLPTRHNYVLALWQEHIERILADWVAELGVPIHRGIDVKGFSQSDSGVEVELSNGSALRAQYLVGCDGGRSMIRKQAGIDFPGWEASTSYLLAECKMIEDPVLGFRRDARGTHAMGRIDEGERVRLVLEEGRVAQGDEPTLDELRALLVAVYGTDFGVHDVTWISRFSDATRQAARYRDRRVLLAGDAAHVHSPVGGQGLNTGMHDAMNLGWKLAQVVRGISPDSLLDSYHAERHPVGARMLRTTMAQTALRRSDERSEAAREILAELLPMSEPRKRLVAMMSGLDVRYDLGEGHALLGRRMPDLELTTENGAQRVFTLLHEARPVLINFGERGALNAGASGWTDRVRQIDARDPGVWELPVLGAVS